MKAFSCIFNKIYLSVMYDAFTFYLTDEGLALEKIEAGKSILSGECKIWENVNIIERINGQFTQDGILSFKSIYRNDAVHYRYHQDDQDIERKHTHKQISKPINKEALNEVLASLVYIKAISPEEKEQGLNAFDQATSLTVEFFNSTKEEQSFNEALLAFYFKSCELRYKARTKSNYLTVATKAQEVHTTIQKAMTNFAENKTSDNYATLKDTCREAMGGAHSLFSTHRGYKNIAGHYSSLFFETKTLKASNTLAKAIENIPEPTELLV